MPGRRGREPLRLLDPDDRADRARLAADAVARGELVVLPTDTVYGLGADAFTAGRRRRAARGQGPRPRHAGAGAGRRAAHPRRAGARTSADAARELVEAFWPGALTLVCRAAPSLAWDLGDTRGTVAVRMPLHPVALELLSRPARWPSRSANRTGGRRPRPRSTRRSSSSATRSRSTSTAARAGRRPLDDRRRAPAPPAGAAGRRRSPLEQLRAVVRRRSTAGAMPADGRSAIRSGARPPSTGRDARSRPSSSDTFWGPDFDALQRQDPDIAGVVLDELDRLRGGLQLIASENFTCPAVLAALGSTLSNKYAEGYPGRRYYGGCDEVDKAEEIGIERAKELFGAEHANLQPHSGASANLAAYGAFLQPGDTVLAMCLPHGGHLTHGSKVNFSGKWFNAVPYGVRQETELIDYDQVARPRPRAPAEDDHLRRHGVPAADRLRRLPRDRRRGRRDPDGRRRALHRPGRRQGDPVARCPTPTSSRFTTHKVLRGPRGGMIVCKAEHAAAHRQGGLPDDAGRPAHARGRGQGRRAQGGRDAGVPGLRPPGHRQRAGARRGPGRRGHAPGRPAAPTPTSR